MMSRHLDGVSNFSAKSDIDACVQNFRLLLISVGLPLWRYSFPFLDEIVNNFWAYSLMDSKDSFAFAYD